MRSMAMILAAWMGFTLVASPAPAADFAVQNGDVVGFLGDSITAARVYSRIIENYTLLRYPDRQAKFINLGIGGDTMFGGADRLDRDVFANKVTLLTVAFGVNDIGWGMKADAEHKKKYLDGVARIVRACQQKGVRVYICSAAITGADPEKSEGEFLQQMCDEGLALANSLGARTIDIQRSMREVQKKIWQANAKVVEPAKKESLHVADGIHLNDLGQLAMAFAILKGLGAPAEVSSAVIDAKTRQPQSVEGCSITGVKQQGDQLLFTRIDQGLPFNMVPLWQLNFRYIDFPSQLNRYMLSVKNLPPGKYDVLADDRGIGTYTEAQLAAGVNISSATSDGWQPGGPWFAQASLLHSLSESRHNLGLAADQSPKWLPKMQAAGEFQSAASDESDRLLKLARRIAAPQPYRFVIRPSNTKSK